MSGSGGEVSPGEISGILGGLLSLATLIGGGIAWLFSRSDTAKKTREDKLNSWQDELEAKEKRLDEGRTAYTARLEERLDVLERNEEARDIQMRALRIAFELVSSALRHIDPQNNALHLADDMLRNAFPVSPTAPADMVQTLIAIEEAEGKHQ